MTTDFQQRLAQLKSEYDLAKKQVQAEKQALKQAQAKVSDTAQAQQIVQAVAEAVQHQAHARIASVVSRCLQAVFGDGYEFRIDFRQARGKTEAQLLIVKDDLVLEDPVEECGGGVVDVASFALRLAALMLAVPRRRRLLLLDEPFRFLSKEYRPAVRELLLALAKELKVQIVMVTHSADLVAGKVIEIGGEHG